MPAPLLSWLPSQGETRSAKGLRRGAREVLGPWPVGALQLRRLRLHVVAADNDHLYEQIDKNTGAQYNAKDLTWSYAETLSALEQRRLALAAVRSDPHGELTFGVSAGW